MGIGRISTLLADNVRELYKNENNVLPDLTIFIQYFGDAIRAFAP